MAQQDRALTRLEQAVARLETALERSLSDPEGGRGRTAGASAGNRDLEDRLEQADAKLESVVAELKLMLESGDASGDGADQRS